MKLTSIKAQLIIFLVGFAIFLSIRDKELKFLLTMLIAVVVAIGIESLIAYLKNKKFALSESSIISGLIIGYVISSDQPWWIFASVSLLAIASKYLIRRNKKHLFNPAAFGIFSVILLFNASTQWKGTYAWYILIPFGLYFIIKIKKIELLLSYIVTTLLIFVIQAVIQKTPIFNIFGYLSFFYIFIMLIEPTTTPIKPFGKIIFGICAAVLIFILTEAGIKFDAELAALLILNLFVPLLNKLPEGRLI